MTRRLQARHHGEPEDVLKLVEVPEDPPPGPGEVTLTVAAVGLNYLDVSLCRGEYTASSALPATLAWRPPATSSAPVRAPST